MLVAAGPSPPPRRRHDGADGGGIVEPQQVFVSPVASGAISARRLRRHDGADDRGLRRLSRSVRVLLDTAPIKSKNNQGRTALMAAMAFLRRAGTAQGGRHFRAVAGGAWAR
jgi:hypothetical protein